MVIPRYSLLLPILTLILLIWGLFGLLKTHEGPVETHTNIFYFVYLVLVVIYLFHASWGLNRLDFNGYNKI